MKKPKTWMVEFVVVLVVLCAIALITQKGYIEWVGVFAVIVTFGHTQIADRLREREQKRYHKENKGDVECYWKLDYYFYTKEILWFVYFIVLGAWSAIAGVVLFLLYPLWRRFYRKKYPLV